MRLRSASHESEKSFSPRRKDIKSSRYHKRIVPLYKENGMLKDRLNKMRFEVEDSLQTIIDNLDKDLQLKGKLISFQQQFELIKEQINKDHEKIESQQDEIERLQQNLGLTVEQHGDEVQSYQQMNKILIEQLQESKQQSHEKEGKQVEQIKIITNQSYQQEVELEQLKKELHLELELTQQLQDKLGQINPNSIEDQLQQQQARYVNEVNQLQSQIELDNKEFKNQLEIQKQEIKQKYALMIYDNKYMLQQIEEMNKNYYLIKQQKESLEKNIEILNLKIKDLKAEIILDKQQVSKNEKSNHESQKELIFQKNKIEILEKREEKYKIQLEENDDDIKYLQSFKVNYLNLQKTLLLKQQAEIDKFQLIQAIELKNLENQIQIQKTKYEQLLGNKVDQKEIEQYQMIEFGQQYNDPVQIKKIQDQNVTIKEQLSLIESFKNNIIKINAANVAEKEIMNSKFQQNKEQLLIEKEQELQVQQTDFDSFKSKQQCDCNFKIQLVSQQFSFQLDQAKKEQKQFQQVIDQFKSYCDEKSKLLVIASQELVKQKNKYDHDMGEEKNNQKQNKYDNEALLVFLNAENQQFQNHLKDKIENLQSQIKELKNKEQILKQKWENLSSDSMKDKQIINSQEKLLGKKQIEAIKQNETVKGLNQRIKCLELEVENAMNTYNIFARSTDSFSLNQQHSTQDIRVKQDVYKKRLSRNNSHQITRNNYLKQQVIPQV